MNAIILCGGISRRMGQDKSELLLNGQSFLERVISNLSQSFPVILAVGDRPRCVSFSCLQTVDRFPGKGPLAGIQAAMEQQAADLYFVTTCDMPLVTKRMAEVLNSHLTDDLDAVVPVDSNGRRHPLCAVYRRTALPVLRDMLARGERRAGLLLDRLKVGYLDLNGCKSLEWQLTNVNTPEDYQRLNRLWLTAQGIPVFAVVAYSGSGKTTFLERLVPELKRDGMRVAVVKHDAHQFDLDREGKDSWRMSKAGADVVGIVSGTGAALMENRPASIRSILDSIQNVDVILTEGYKHEGWPKFMLHREAAGKPLPLEPAQCLAVISDVQIPAAPRQFSLDDAAGVAKFILETMGWMI